MSSPMIMERPRESCLVEVEKSRERPPFNIESCLVEVEKSREQYPIILSELLKNSESYVTNHVSCPYFITRCFQQASKKAVDKLKESARTITPFEMKTLLTDYVSRTLLSDLFKQHKDLYANILLDAATHENENETKNADDNNNNNDNDPYHDSECAYDYDCDEEDPKFFGIHKVRGGSSGDSFFVQGVAFENTLSRVGQPMTVLRNPKILLVDIKRLLGSEKEKAEIRFIDGCLKCGATMILSTSTMPDVATKFFQYWGIVCIDLVAKHDLERLAIATGASIVESFTIFHAKFLEECLGTPEEFIEKEIGSTVFNIFRGCKVRETATIVVYEADKFDNKEARIFHDEILFVRSALKDSTIVNTEIYMEISQYLKDHAQSVGGESQQYIEMFANALEVTSEELRSDATDSTIVWEPTVLKIDALIVATGYAKTLVPVVEDN